MDKADVLLRQSGNVLYLFSSNYRFRYLQDVLNVLCLPPGFLYHFRYERKWIDAEIRNSVDEEEVLPSKVCVVFVDRHVEGEPCREPVFHPIRVGELVKVEVDGDVLHIYFLVKEYAKYNKERESSFQNLIKDELPIHKRPLEVYACIGNLMSDFYGGNGELARDWQSIVSVIAQARCLQNAVFWRMDHPVKRTKKKVELSGPRQIVHLRTGYEFDANSYYTIPISFFRPDQPAQIPDSVSLRVEMDPGLFLTSQPTLLEANVRYDRLWIDLPTRRRTSQMLSSFLLSLSNKADADAYSIAPHVEFPLRIKPSRLRYVAGLCILLGVVLIAIGTAVSGITGGLLAGLGAVFATVTLWWLTGDVNQGSRGSGG